ncbi:MAG: signal peptidase I [Ruminococcaceae bacterium]|nr:signal peptidase I [Oscillospiraceae bacterium]
MNKDDFNKTPDDIIKNADENELNDILKRLSEILDTSVSLQDAIDLAKKKHEEEAALKEAQEESISSFSEFEYTPEGDASDNAAETEEYVTAESDSRNDSPLDFSEYASFKLEKEDVADAVEEVSEPEKPEESENIETEEKLNKEPFTIDVQEDVEEEKEEPVFEFSIPAPETNEQEAQEENATSKIFDELLACFENRKLPDDFRFSSFQEHSEDVTEAEESAETIEVTEEAPSEAQPEQTTAEGTEDGIELQKQIEAFSPIYHHNPDEEDEIFSQIFYDEKKQRARKEKDKKKWQKQAADGSTILRSFFDWMEIIVLSSALALLIFTFVMRLAVVDGNSMNNTLHNKELLVISDFMYTPKNNDIIVFNAPSYSDEPIVKRIIATEGQTVDIDFENWIVTVDGEPLEEDYVKKVAGYMHASDIQFPLTVPEGYLFVMGDNRNDSLDSRDSRIGLVDERFILGEVKIRLSPLNKFGKVD